MNIQNFFTVFLCILLSIQTWAQTDSDDGTIIRVLTFNIYHGETMNEDYDLDKIAQVIIDAKPDFVALQEVDFKTNRAKKYDLVTELGWRAKMLPLFGKAMSYDGGEYGEGILSKHPFMSSRNINLPYQPGYEPRAALEITVALPSKDTIAFIGTHLDHTKKKANRVAQVKRINEVFSSNQYPTILAGDLNAEPKSKPISILEKVWTPTYNNDNMGFTYPSDNPTKKIDYIMFYPKNRWEVINRQIIADTIASDHCAYLVTLKLEKP